MQCVGRRSDPPGNHPAGVKRDASCTPVLDASSGRRLSSGSTGESPRPSSSAKGFRGPAYGLFLFSFLGAAVNGSGNPQVQKPIMKPIILQVLNRDANSAKLIRPGQAMFSGLQNAPDSDRFTLFLRRFWVRVPARAPGTDSCPW